MPAFSVKSLEKLNSCHIDLQRLFLEVVKTYDCSVICGYRDKKTQNQAFKDGTSKLKYPESKHNKKPSIAVDVIPYPVSWKNYRRFYHFAGYVTATAERLSIKIRSGVDWDSDFDLDDQLFIDAPHYELITED